MHFQICISNFHCVFRNVQQKVNLNAWKVQQIHLGEWGIPGWTAQRDKIIKLHYKCMKRTH